jgi:predicted MFS family arabinose efflux permease
MTGPNSTTAARRLITSASAAFAAFGAFWGVWGASIPRVQEQAGITAGQLGLALLFVGAGALPAMLLTGRALDRWGLKVAAAAITALGATGAGAVLAGRDLPSLCGGLTLVGAASGAADVAMNATIGRAENLTGRPVITRAHGVFTAAVVLSSLTTGLTSATALPPVTPFLAVAALCLAAGLYMLWTLPPTQLADRPAAPRTAGRSPIAPLILMGVLGALAFASENAHQSWAAVYAQDELHTSPGLAAIAPAVFAATVAITRLSIGTLTSAPARRIILAGALADAVGAILIATASSLFIAALGLVVVGAGTAVLFPTLLAVVSRHVEESHRGRATSIVTTVSYLGFLLGPVYVGQWADAAGLRTAMIAVAALAVILFALTPALLRLSGFSPQTQPASGESTKSGAASAYRMEGGSARPGPRQTGNQPR